MSKEEKMKNGKNRKLTAGSSCSNRRTNDDSGMFISLNVISVGPAAADVEGAVCVRDVDVGPIDRTVARTCS
jgi:hypothetical protein